MKRYLSNFVKTHSIKEIENMIKKLKDLNVLVIGDTIIDEYHFTITKGRAIKDPIISVGYDHHEIYAGGILAIANNVSHYVNKVKLVTLLGDRKRKEDFIRNSMNKNIELKFFTKENSPTVIKRRFLDKVRNTKLFKIEYLNDTPISKSLENKIISYLEKNLGKYDLVLVGDFGHGFITSGIISIIEDKSKFLSVNCQTNSSNFGYNYVTKYNNLDFIVMNTEEVQLPLGNRYSSIEPLVRLLSKKTKFNQFLVSLSKEGCLYFYHDKILKAPAFVEKTIDTVGAGDAVFAIISLLVYRNENPEVIPFIANCVGGVAVSIMGNKESVDKEKLFNFIEKVYSDGLE